MVRNNLIHDVNAHSYGGWGLYTDEGSTGIVLESNVVYRCKSATFHQHYGRDNVIRNNVLAFGHEHQIMRSREEAHLSFIFTNNIVYFDSGELLGSIGLNNNFRMDSNVYWDTPAWRLSGDDSVQRRNTRGMAKARPRSAFDRQPIHCSLLPKSSTSGFSRALRP